MEKKAKIVISHRLHDAGMKVLEDAGADIVITDSGEPKDMLPALRDADGVIIRIGSIDRVRRSGVPVSASTMWTLRRQPSSGFPSSSRRGRIRAPLPSTQWR